MEKSAEAFRTISEVAEWLGTPTHVLRFWESRFPQIKPLKRAGGRRYYRPADMMLLGGIKQLLHDDGMTIRGAQKILAEKGVKHVMALSPPLETPPIPDPDAEERAAAERRARRRARRRAAPQPVPEAPAEVAAAPSTDAAPPEPVPRPVAPAPARMPAQDPPSETPLEGRDTARTDAQEYGELPLMAPRPPLARDTAIVESEAPRAARRRQDTAITDALGTGDIPAFLRKVRPSQRVLRTLDMVEKERVGLLYRRLAALRDRMRAGAPAGK